MALSLTPILIGGVECSNRIFMSPMCQYSSIDGYANEWHLVHYGSRAVGRAGLIMLEATAVSPEGRITPDDLGIWKDEHIHELSKITNFVHKQDTKIGIQLAHAGRKASTTSPWKGYYQLKPDNGGWTTLAPSSIPFNEDDSIPHSLTIDEVQQVVSQFRDAARRATSAGFDIIELHAAHGYLIHQFLSPIANHRSDDYGGSFEHRIRLLMQIVDAVKQEMNDSQALFVRISATDYIDGGWDLPQSIALAELLYNRGVHLIDVSSGAMLPNVAIDVKPNYQVPFAEAIKKQSRIAVGTVGVIYEAKQVEDIIRSGKADVVFIGRELLRNPYFVIDSYQQLSQSNTYPNQYLRAYRK